MAAEMWAMVQTAGEGRPTLTRRRIPVPKPGAHQMLVKTSHAAQNPTDVLSLDGKRFGDGAVLGCDFVGTVEEVGPDVVRSKKGDIIAGLVRGGPTEGLGAYSEYTLADDRISFKVPTSISHAAAATVPLAAATAWLALFSKDCLNIDRNGQDTRSVLIWGGSSSVGLYAIQLAKLEKLNVITTCSPRNFDLVKKHGADQVNDYSDANVIDAIKKAEPNLQYVFDTIGNSTSSVKASQAIREEGGSLCTVRPGKMFTEGVSKQAKVTDVMVWTASLKELSFGKFVWPVSEHDHELVSELFKRIPGLIDEGKFRPNRPEVKRGLEAVPEGFQEYRDGKVSGYKIVYEL